MIPAGQSVNCYKKILAGETDLDVLMDAQNARREALQLDVEACGPAAPEQQLQRAGPTLDPEAAVSDVDDDVAAVQELLDADGDEDNLSEVLSAV